jgi:hypothetical protein
MWRIYQSRIYINAVQSNVVQSLGTMKLSDNIDIFDGDSDSEDVDEEDTDETMNTSIDNDENLSGDNLEAVAAEQQCAASFVQEWKDEMESVVDKEQTKLLEQLKDLSCSVTKLSASLTSGTRPTTLEELRKLRQKVANLTAVFETMSFANTDADFEGSLRSSGVEAPFKKQAKNFGSDLTFAPILTVTVNTKHRQPITNSATSTCSLPGDSQGPQIPSSVAEDLENKPLENHNTPRAVDANTKHDETLDIGSLFKVKKRKQRREPTAEWLAQTRIPFDTFAAQLLNDEGCLERIAEAKRLALISGLPLLRAALGWNTANRIRAVAYGLFGLTFPVSWNKGVLISKLLEHIAEIAPSCPEDVALAIADVGIVHTEDDGLRKNEILFLRTNALSNTGKSCVSFCKSFPWTGLSGC